METLKKLQSEIASLKREIGDLRHWGGQLANIAFNLGQNDSLPCDPSTRKKLKELQESWDKISRAK